MATVNITDWNDWDSIPDAGTDTYILQNTLDEDTAGYDSVAGPNARSGKGLQPIGTPSNPFDGVIDGNGYAVRDIHMEEPDSSPRYCSLVSSGTGGGQSEIKNLIVEGYFRSSLAAPVAGFAGTKITNVAAFGEAVGIEGSSSQYGAVGFSLVGNAKNCYSAVDVSVESGTDLSKTSLFAINNFDSVTTDGVYTAATQQGADEEYRIIGDGANSTVQNVVAPEGTAPLYGNTDSNFSSSNVIELPREQMQGDRAKYTMFPLYDGRAAFETVSGSEGEVAVDGYPTLSGLDRTTQLDLYGVLAQDVGEPGFISVTHPATAPKTGSTLVVQVETDVDLASVSNLSFSVVDPSGGRTGVVLDDSDPEVEVYTKAENIPVDIADGLNLYVPEATTPLADPLAGRYVAVVDTDNLSAGDYLTVTRVEWGSNRSAELDPETVTVEGSAL